MISGIYKITNMDTGKFYIGSAEDTDWRWVIHRRNLRANTHCNPKLQHSWNFHGEDRFTFSVLEEVEPDQIKLFAREQHYLDVLKPWMREVGYNICPTACGGDNITNHPDRAAFIEKMKIVNHGESNGMYGKMHTEGAIRKQKEKSVGRYTLEWFVEKYGKREGKKRFVSRNHMLKNRKINYSYENINKGKCIGPMSEESKQKITETKRRMKEIKPLLINDIKSDRYTLKMLTEKYDINMNVVKHYKQKLRKKGKL